MTIYNKSSEYMGEVVDNSVDLIVASVPYNDGTMYGTYVDAMPLEKYREKMQNVVRECTRILDTKGLLIIEVADTVITDGRFVQLAALWQDMALAAGLHLYQRHINFVQTNEGVEVAPHTETFISEPVTTGSSEVHSNACQWLVFSKDARPFSGGEVFYQNYVYDQEEHHCPFTDEFCETFLHIGEFRPGMVVLEPFMGTGNFGVHVLQRRGKYIGYEIDLKIFQKAREKLSSTV